MQLNIVICNCIRKSPRTRGRRRGSQFSQCTARTHCRRWTSRRFFHLWRKARESISLLWSGSRGSLSKLYSSSLLSILFYRAGMYWIYILSLHPSCLKGNFQYTPALEKRMAIHCLESGWIGKYAPLGNLHPSALEITLGQSLGPRGANCLRGRIFQYTPPLGSVLLQCR